VRGVGGGAGGFVAKAPQVGRCAAEACEVLVNVTVSGAAPKRGLTTKSTFTIVTVVVASCVLTPLLAVTMAVYVPGAG